MSRPLAARTAQVGPAGPLAAVAAARALEARGHRLSRLDIGEPHFPTPPHIVEAALAAMRDGGTRYAPPQGLPALRAAIADRAAANGIDSSPENVVIASGVKPMLLYTMLALAQAGDEVLVPDPGYAGYAAAARLAGAAARPYPAAAHGGIDVDALGDLITPASRVLVLNSPHNPTGAVIDQPTLTALAALAERHDLWVVSDEIYGSLTYDGPAPLSIAAIPGMRERTIVLDGFSKAYAMTGWRLGYALLPEPLVTPVTAIVGDAATCTPPFVQQAGVAALTGPQDFVGEMRLAYRARRDALVARLRAIPGVRVATPAGALYAFPDVGAVMDQAAITSSAALATTLLQQHRLACVAGAAFGSRGERHLRFSFAVDEPQLAAAARRLDGWAAAVG